MCKKKKSCLSVCVLRLFLRHRFTFSIALCICVKFEMGSIILNVMELYERKNMMILLYLDNVEKQKTALGFSGYMFRLQFMGA